MRSTRPSALRHKWDVVYQSGRDFRRATSQDVELIVDQCAVKGRVACLDIGCGTGQLAVALSRPSFAVTGIDVSAVAVDLARRRARKARAVSVSFKAHDFDSFLRSADVGTYGLVVCRLVYAFLNNRSGFLRGVYSLLAPGGTFVLIVALPHQAPADRLDVSVDDQVVSAGLVEYFDFHTVEHDGLTYYFCKQVAP